MHRESQTKKRANHPLIKNIHSFFGLFPIFQWIFTIGIVVEVVDGQIWWIWLFLALLDTSCDIAPASDLSVKMPTCNKRLPKSDQGSPALQLNWLVRKTVWLQKVFWKPLYLTVLPNRKTWRMWITCRTWNDRKYQEIVITLWCACAENSLRTTYLGKRGSV